MERLTKTEERVMQILWRLKKALVRDVMAQLPPPPPPYTTVSSVIRLLEEKGFVSHKAYGRTYEYFPLVSKSDYRRFAFRHLLKDYFDGSYENVVSFLAEESQLSPEEIQQLQTLIDQDEQNHSSS